MVEYYKSDKGYYYVKYNNGNKKRISKDTYKLNLNKKSKIINQKGGKFNISNAILSDNTDRFILSEKIIKSNKCIEIYDSLFNNRHLLLSNKYKYILLYDEDSNNVYIINKELTFITDKGFLDDILADVSATSADISAPDTFNKISFVKQLLKQNIKTIFTNNNLECFNINLTEAHKKLEQLNILLKNKCTQLELKLDNYYNMTGDVTLYNSNQNKDKLILCLYYNDNCISSIFLKYKNSNQIEIETSTNILYKKRKYNKLLTISTIILAPLLVCNGENINVIMSAAIAVESALTLIPNFETDIEHPIPTDFEEFIEKNKFDENTDIKYLLTELYKQIPDYVGLLIYVTLNKDNIDKAYVLFKKLISSEEFQTIICP
jgi:hypothetical protein